MYINVAQTMMALEVTFSHWDFETFDDESQIHEDRYMEGSIYDNVATSK